MIAITVKPHPALQSFISRIMLFRYVLDRSIPRPINPFPPQPEHSLYFYPYDRARCYNYSTLNTEEVPRSILVGPQLSRVDLTMDYNMLVIYIGFHPGGLHRLLGIPMHEIVDQHFDSTLFLGKEIDQILDQLNTAKTHNEMIDYVQSYLLHKASRLMKIQLPLDYVLSQQLKNGKLVNVHMLSQQACVSVRQLERQFKERIGMSPKLFFRLVRFSKAWYLREKDPLTSWSEIAHTCDYADQMHMIRDFKDFVGITPGLLQHDLDKSPLRLRADLGY